MYQLSQLLECATSRVASPYFEVPIAGGQPTLRERVYCYELYHQLRCYWKDDEGYTLNGELDKTAHPILTGLGLGTLKPDLLVHRPGDMHGNHAIIEVKSSNAQKRGLKKDIQTLAGFRRKAGYQRAILLIFGAEADQTITRATQIASEEQDLPTIELWTHTAAGSRAVCVKSIGDV